MTDDIRRQYIARLKSIYKDGLWFQSQYADKITGVGSQEIKLPSYPNICFTELRPEHSRSFCRHYGKLGIGIGRRYLMVHGANPVLYVQNADTGIVNTNLASIGSGSAIMCYVKPMSRAPTNDDLDFYEEHEWRMIWPPPLRMPDGTLRDPEPPFVQYPTEDGPRKTFRFACNEVRKIIFPDNVARAMADDDPIMRQIWAEHRPDLTDLDEVAPKNAES